MTGKRPPPDHPTTRWIAPARLAVYVITASALGGIATATAGDYAANAGAPGELRGLLTIVTAALVAGLAVLFHVAVVRTWDQA